MNIKLRVWDKEQGKFLISDRLDISDTDEDENRLRGELFCTRKLGEKYGYISFYPSKNLVYQQYLNRFDKNGKEECEGDILKIIISEEFINHGEYLAIIEKNKERFYLNQKRKFNDWIIGDRMKMWPSFEDGVKVGNIFENPELIKQIEESPDAPNF